MYEVILDGDTEKYTPLWRWIGTDTYGISLEMELNKIISGFLQNSTQYADPPVVDAM